MNYISLIKRSAQTVKGKFFFCFYGLFFVLFFQAAVYSQPVYEYDWFFFLYEYEKTDNFTSKVVRPFYLNHAEKNKTYSASLMPLIWSAYDKPGNNEWKSLFGLIGSNDYTHNDGVRDYDFGFFPFLLFGKSKNPADQYLHIWPFGGKIKGKLGQDNITAYGFPLVLLLLLYPPSGLPLGYAAGGMLIASVIMPAYVEYNSRDYYAQGILWPLVQWGSNDKRKDFRILPFYSHNRKTGVYDNYSLLMLFNYSRVFLEEDEERTLFAVPLIARRWNISDRRGGSSLLWPVFSWGYDIKRGSFELNFPWPLVQYQDSSEPLIKKRILFPFYGVYEYENKRKFSFVTPLYISIENRTPALNSEYYITCFLFWYFKRDYQKAADPEYGTSWRYIKLWPLFQYEYDDRGNLSFNMLSLFPFRDKYGYERMYQAFWTLFEYHRLSGGEKRLGFLWRLYFQRWGNDFFSMKIPLIFSYSVSHGSLKEWSCLLRMFGYENSSKGRYCRIFWIPLRLGDGDASGDIGVTDNKDNNIPDEEIQEYYSVYALYNSTDVSVGTGRNNFIIYKVNIF